VEAATLKDPQVVARRLAGFYRGLAPSDQSHAIGVLRDWLLSEDEARRWDAQSLIDDMSLVEAVPALRELADRLESSDSPGAPYEWAKVNRLIGQLTGPDRRSG